MDELEFFTTEDGLFTCKPAELKDLYMWCLMQAHDRQRGVLAQEKIDKLNSIGFPWDYYENELEKLDNL
jgi:hypothetical protein